MNEIKDISHAESLLLNFFNGEIYFIFDSQDEVESFFKYIAFFDQRYTEEYNPKFTRKQVVKSVAWQYIRQLHKMQLAWQNETEYFENEEGLKPVSYSIVRSFVDTEVRTMEFAEEFFAKHYKKIMKLLEE